jgi:hypothetical protein
MMEVVIFPFLCLLCVACCFKNSTKFSPSFSMSLGHVLFISLCCCFTIITNSIEALGFSMCFGGA